MTLYKYKGAISAKTSATKKSEIFQYKPVLWCFFGAIAMDKLVQSSYPEQKNWTPAYSTTKEERQPINIGSVTHIK